MSYRNIIIMLDQLLANASIYFFGYLIDAKDKLDLNFDPTQFMTA